MSEENDTATITCTEQFIDQVPATAARLYVSVSGDKLFTGNAALKQAVAVRKLIKRLGAEGVTDENISLSSVHVEVSGGLFSRSSSATYLLCVAVDELEFLSGVLDAVSDQKNCQIRSIDWKYDDSQERKARWLARCIAAIQTKAEAMAAALGVKLADVARATEETLGEPKLDVPMAYQPQLDYAQPIVRARKSAFAAASVGDALSTGELAPSREMGVRVTVTYRVVAPTPTTS